MDSSTQTPTAKTNAVDAVESSNEPSAAKPHYHVHSLYQTYEVYGVDVIWHNQYLGPNSDFFGMRKQYDADINAMILKVTEHMKAGLYTIISMNATPHMLTVICACEKMNADFPADMWDEPES